MKKISIFLTAIILASCIFSSDFIKVTGQVLSQDGLKPISGVTIQGQYDTTYGCEESTEDFIRFTSSNKEGRFTLILPKIDRDYVIFLSHPKGHIFSIYGDINQNTDLGTIQLPRFCKISGTVFDNNGNTLPNITIMARIRLHHTHCPVYREVNKTRTDKNGKFIFKNLSPAEYKIRIISDEFAQTQETINLSRDQKHLRLLTYKSATIQGRVTDPSDHPVAGIMIEINQFFKSNTDQNGYYRIGGLKTGSYEINMCGMGYGLPHNKSIHLNLSAGHELTHHIRIVPTGKLRIHIQPEENVIIPDTLEISLYDKKHPRGGYNFLKTKVVSSIAEFENIVPGTYILSTKNDEFPKKTTHITIQYNQLTEQTISVSPSLVFKGKVFTEEKKPLFNAKIELRSKSKPATKYGSSDKNGNFIFKGLLPDCYTLEINHNKAINSKKEIHIKKTSITPETFMLKTGASISGRVLNEAKTPLNNVSVSVQGIMPPSNYKEGKTEKNGSFIITGLRPGKIKIHLSEKHSVPFSKKIFVKNRTSLKEPFVLKKGLILKGKVVDEKEKPVGLASIFCRKKDEYRYRYCKSTKTDFQGRFILKGLLPGTLTLKVEKEEFIAFEKDIQFTEDLTQRKPLVLTVKKGLRIAGKVIEADGAVCNRMEVNVIGAKRRWPNGCIEPMYVTDSNGIFILDGLKKGLYSISITDKESHNQILTVKDIPAGKEDLVIKLPQKHNISGIVVNSTGTPVSDVKIEVYMIKKGRFEQLSTDANGKFQIELRQGSKYGFHFSHKSYLPSFQEVNLISGSADSKKALSVILKSGFSISGTVVRGDHNIPAPNLLVAPSKHDYYPIMFSDPEQNKVTKTNNDGAFKIKGIESGICILHVYEDNDNGTPLTLAKKQVLVEDKDIANLKIKIKNWETGSIKVQVVFDDGLPVSDCLVQIFTLNRDTPVIKGGETNENGIYVFNDMLPGKYLVICFSFDLDDGPIDINKSELVIVEKNKTSEVIIGKPKDTKGLSIIGRVSKDGFPLKSGKIILCPVKNKKLKLTEDNIFDIIKHVKQGIIDEQGKFIVKGLQPGNFIYEIKNIKEEKGLSFGGWIKIIDSQKNINININVIKLTGVIMGSDGSVVPGATVEISSAESNELLKELLSRGRISDKNGKYEINYIVPGLYDISVKHPEWCYLEKKGVNLLKSIEEFDFKLNKGFSISGSVKNYNNTPGIGALVLVVDESGHVTTSTSSFKNGNFNTKNILSKGRYTVYTYLTGHTLDFQSMDIKQNNIHNLKLNLGGNLEVVLKGKPEKIAGKNIKIKKFQGKEIRRLKINNITTASWLSFFTIQPTDSEGKTKIFGLKPGFYTVSVQGTPLSKKVKIIALDTVTCELEI